MIEVVAGLICRDGRFLACQRPQGKSCALLWEFPGGKIEPGESGAQAISRELREELALETETGALLAETTHVYPEKAVHLSLYAVRPLCEPKALEHADIRWVNRNEAEALPFCPADVELIALLDAQGWPL